MPADLPKEFRSGTRLTAEFLDALVKELWRWRRFTAAAPLELSDADGGKGDEPPSLVGPYPAEEFFIQLTGGPDSNGGYDWQMVYHSAPNSWATTGLSNTAANGDAAYPMEWASAVKCPYIKDTVRVFLARRVEGTGALMFRGGNGPFRAKAGGGGIPANGGTGNVTFDSGGGVASGPTVTATNNWKTAVPANVWCECWLRNGVLLAEIWDCS